MSRTASGEETITIHELLERSAESALEFQREDGSFPPGRNYTYDEPETPVRTTSNWLRVLLKSYQITGDETYRNAATDATDYLLSENRPHGYTYYCRKTANKDHCNGLVGQAKPIRALADAGTTLNRDDALVTAKSVYDLHPFDTDLGLWRRVETTGEDLGFDRTLNHQIIFAEAAAALTDEYFCVEDDLMTFLDGLVTNLRVHDDGLIQHYIRPRVGDVGRAVLRDLSSWPLAWNELAIHYHYRLGYEERRRKEIGYQPVNLRSLGPLKQRYESHPLWTTEKIDQAIAYVTMQEYQSDMYDINAGATIPGIMTAFSLLTLDDVFPENIVHLIEKDLERQLDPETYLLTSEMIASSDQASSICALVDFPDIGLTITT